MVNMKTNSANLIASNPETGEIGSINLNLWLVNLSGVPLIGLKKETNFVKFLILIYGFCIISFICFIYTSFEIYDLIMNLDDLDKITANISMSLSHVSGAVKTMNLIFRRNDLKRVFEKIKYVTKTYVKSEKQFESFKKGEFETKLALIIYMIVVEFTASLGIIFLFMHPETVAGEIFPYRVLLPKWLPMFWQQLYMGLGILIFGMQIVAVDCLNVTIINQIRIHLDVLSLSFEELIIEEKSAINTKKDSKALIPFKKNPLKCLNSIVEHHCLLREIRQMTEDIFSRPLLFQFFGSLMVFAMTGFQATVKPSGSNSAILIYFYCGCIFCQLFVYCWFGNEVFEQSKTISTSGFNSSWYLFEQRYGKSLVLFLTNAQRPFVFTAGGFVNLSLPSFAGLLGKSYSYIALLRQVYGK